MKKIALIVAISMIVLVGSVGAYEAISGVQVDNIETANFVFGGVPEVSGEAFFGADGDSNFTNVVAEGDITAGDDLVVGDQIDAGGKITGGGDITNATSTLQVATSLTAAQVCDSQVITVNSGCTAGTVACNVAASLDITMPATSTLWADCLESDGDSTSFIFVNASPTAASTTEMIAGTGCESFKSQDTGAADTVPGLGAAKITFIRADDYMGSSGANDCIMTVEPFIYD